jgi:hypothetical protein
MALYNCYHQPKDQMIKVKRSLFQVCYQMSALILPTLFVMGCNSGSPNSNPRNPSGLGPAPVALSPSGGDAAAGDLGAAGNYVILAKTGISNVTGSAITGFVGISPAAATYITGFSLVPDATNVFSTSSSVTGKVYAATYASPTPSNLTSAIGNMETAYTAAAGRNPPDFTELGTGNLGGLTLAPGLYKWGTAVSIPTSVTISGSATDVWIFQIAGDLVVSAAQNVVLSGGALAKNIYWQVAGQVTLRTTSHFEGIILCKTAVVVQTGANMNGRIFAQSAVSLDNNTITQP